MLELLILTVIIALLFDFTNGFHDAANSIATVVATKVLNPKIAVIWAAFFNFVAAFIFGIKIAATIGKGVVDPHYITIYVVLAGLLGAISWNLLTWYFGMPTSSSHALIGALVGSMVAHAGFHPIQWAGIQKIVIFILLSPLVGMSLGFILKALSTFYFKKVLPNTLDAYSRKCQLISSALYSLGHGTNDAQKTMGVIAVLLVSSQAAVPELKNAPHWLMPNNDLTYIPWVIILAAHLAIALGTLAGGWRIVRTLAYKLTDLDPLGGCCAETGGATTLFLASHLGVPVSTTHAITGAIVGVGTEGRHGTVRWPMVGKIIWAWIATVPGAALFSWVLYHLVIHIRP